MADVMRDKVLEREACEKAKECPLIREAMASTPCDQGMAGEFPCRDIDLSSFVPVDALGGDRGTNDIWGWTDQKTGREYALVGLVEGTSFVDISDPAHPTVIGAMRTQTYNSIWRDLKVYDNHVFVVSEAPGHGMQVFDLTRLRSFTGRDSLGVRPGAIRKRNDHDFCLEASTNLTALRMRPCSDGAPAQNWTYDRKTGLIVEQDGLCLSAWSSPENASIAWTKEIRAGAGAAARECNSSDASQQWTYVEVSSRFRLRDRPSWWSPWLCLTTLQQNATEDEAVHLTECDADDLGQQWTLGASVLEEFLPDAVYSEVTSSHNIAINEQTAMAYILGTRTCNGGLHMVDISVPTEPSFAGCFSEDNYTHDAQCVVYNGPDKRFRGKELCFAYNEDTLTIVDLSSRERPKAIARVGYNNSVYTHQGWLDMEQRYLFMDDELDEASSSPSNPSGPSNHTRTLMWDVRLLDNPVLIDSFYSNETSIDHNMYVDGKVVFQSNYCAGLRMLEIISKEGEAQPLRLREIGFLDIEPECNTPSFKGSWSNFPYFPSGVVAVTSISRGLFVATPRFSSRSYLAKSRTSHRQKSSKRNAALRR
jgi:choice-of-anchor B domain-containing protein